ncbi:MAG: GNAT family N-acetyltransferase [Chloroflexi bacterium]|nr:GNAT family N-acetyltransferase [Chloroflexota bacterium]
MLSIRRATEKDRPDILAATTDVGVFTQEEVACVDELLDVFLHKPDSHDYTFVVSCDQADCAVGFACYGPTPLTNGTFDLYWLCVARRAQGQGVARALLERVRQELVLLGARLLVAETSSTPAYEAARSFYEHNGFSFRTVVPDFYHPGDDLVLYVMYLPQEVGLTPEPSGTQQTPTTGLDQNNDRGQ